MQKTKTDCLAELHSELRANYGFWDEEKDKLYKRVLKEMLAGNGEPRTRRAIHDCIRHEGQLSVEKLWKWLPPRIEREGQSEVQHERFLCNPDCSCGGSGFRYTETQQGNQAVYACEGREAWRRAK
jgi:hypothetical protein